MNWYLNASERVKNMTIDVDDLIKSITESLNRIDYIKADDIPNIDLYMDQVTSFFDSRLRATTRNKEEDKILTKTMINNYAKNDLLPPPVKKKYSKDHMIVLLIIYYFKNFLSINDVEAIIKPLNDRYFNKDEGLSLVDIYEEIREQEIKQNDVVIEDIKSKYETAMHMYNTGDSEEEEILRIFAFITLMSADVYIKKLLIEKLIDGYRDKLNNTMGEEKDSKKDK